MARTGTTGGMPTARLLEKFARTPPGLLAPSGREERTGWAHKDYQMGALLDRTPDTPYLASDAPQQNGAASRNRLNMQYNGSRGSTGEMPAHPDLFLGHMGDDPRGAGTDPRFDRGRDFIMAKARELEPRFGKSVGHGDMQEAERPWTARSLQRARVEMHEQARHRLKIFTPSKAGRAAGLHVYTGAPVDRRRAIGEGGEHFAGTEGAGRTGKGLGGREGARQGSQKLGSRGFARGSQQDTDFGAADRRRTLARRNQSVAKAMGREEQAARRRTAQAPGVTQFGAGLKSRAPVTAKGREDSGRAAYEALAGHPSARSAQGSAAGRGLHSAKDVGRAQRGVLAPGARGDQLAEKMQRPGRGHQKTGDRTVAGRQIETAYTQAAASGLTAHNYSGAQPQVRRSDLSSQDLARAAAAESSTRAQSGKAPDVRRHDGALQEVARAGADERANVAASGRAREYHGYTQMAGRVHATGAVAAPAVESARRGARFGAGSARADRVTAGESLHENLAAAPGLFE